MSKRSHEDEPFTAVSIIVNRIDIEDVKSHPIKVHLPLQPKDPLHTLIKAAISYCHKRGLSSKLHPSHPDDPLYYDLKIHRRDDPSDRPIVYPSEVFYPEEAGSLFVMCLSFRRTPYSLDPFSLKLTKSLGKTFTVTCSPSERISDLQVKLEPILNIPVSCQILVKPKTIDPILQGRFTLAEYNLEDQSQLFVFGKSSPSDQNIQIYTHKKDWFSLSYDQSTTISQLKQTIEQQEGVSFASQEIFHDETKCPNEATLLELGIPVGSVLLLRIPLIQIFIKTLTGKTITLDVGQLDYVVQIKRMVEIMEGIPLSKQRLIYGGHQLENHQTLASHKIERESTLHLVLRMGGN